MDMRRKLLEPAGLTAAEEALFATLMGAAEHGGQGTVVRAAGGWVRDKLLGKESDDVDITVVNRKGFRARLRASRCLLRLLAPALSSSLLLLPALLRTRLRSLALSAPPLSSMGCL